ncbi:hypothetical protein PPERSA_00297 [Pseudocohnilembus persalinus]|uniref:FAD dependent oxidoreductase domain-containing protein n=1 Tax=Pseudocohnilembus persalinus TaxID=266149 RepID=A0A0V0Q961_PSEPJ|nr:hypothetical protein PPERSA_00297 [Pseudocohnilembus persalinus]|eukprot:KRW98709.1 hypothetical protein PPERSA_00297 [Pseudocohnilembus persalinus]
MSANNKSWLYLPQNIQEKTQNSQQKPSVCIIGAGIVGLTSAYFLQKSNFFGKITIIEKEKEPGTAASFVNAGYLVFSKVIPVCEQLRNINLSIFKYMDINLENLYQATRFGIYAYYDFFKGALSSKYKQERTETYSVYGERCKETFWKILQDEGIKESEIGLQRGCNYLYRDENKFKNSLEILEQQKKPYIIQNIPLKQNKNGYLQKMITNNEDCTASSWHFLNILLKKMEKKGNFQLITGKEVTELIKNEKNNRIIDGIKCKDGEIIKSNYFIFCNNGLIQHIISYPLVIMSGFSWTFYKNNTKNQALINEVDNCPSVVDYEKCIYYSIYNDRLRVTYGFYLNPNFQKLKNDFKQYTPNFPFWKDEAEKQVENMTIGTRCVSPNGAPFLGQLGDYENAFINTGHGFIGWTLSTYTGLLLSKIILQKMGHQIEFDQIEKNIMKITNPKRYII